MPFDPILAERMRQGFLGRSGASERKMFGGVGFFVFGNMCCGVWKDLLVVRLSAEEGSEALNEPHTRPMDITGKPMKGWIFVEPEGHKDDSDLMQWIDRAYAFAALLPKK